MSIDPISEVNLDENPDSLGPAKIALLSQASPRPITLVCSPEHLDRAKGALMRLRSQGVPAILFLNARDACLEDEEVGVILAFLRDWDQLLLRNVLELCFDGVPQEFQPLLQQEAKTELKWFQEWQTAAHDPRIHQYPSLPWRSFIRRINSENYQFAVDFLTRIDSPATAENREGMVASLREFLIAKKKAICLFPKRKIVKEGPDA